MYGQTLLNNAIDGAVGETIIVYRKYSEQEEQYMHPKGLSDSH